MTIDEQIERIDRGIKVHEAALKFLNEKRRELVNRGNLNKRVNSRCIKGFHSYVNPDMTCCICGERVL